MKKNPPDVWGCSHYVKKFFLVMKLTLFLVFFFLASANAFTQKVTLLVKSATLNEVLRQIKDQSGVRILYDAGKTKQIQCEGIKIVDMNIAEALGQVLKDTRFEFFEEGGVYIVREMTAQQAKILRIVGKVVDEKKQPLPGVTVQLKGVSIGTATTGDMYFRYPMHRRNLPWFFLLSG